MNWQEEMRKTADNLAELYSVTGTHNYSLHRLHNLLTGGQYDGLLDLLPADMRDEYLRLRAKKEAQA